NMNTYASAERKVQQALDAGRDVNILYVYREPVEALVNCALPRAERQRAEFGTGRTVPLSEHIRTHANVRGVMERLAEKYRDDPRVQIRAYDNSRGKGMGAFADIADLPQVEENGLHERLSEAIAKEHQAGRISDATLAGFNAAGRAEGVQRQAVQGARPQPEAKPPSAILTEGTRAPDAASGGTPTSAAPATGRTEPGTTAPNPETVAGAGEGAGADSAVARARSAAQGVTLADGTPAADAMKAADG